MGLIPPLQAIHDLETELGNTRVPSSVSLGGGVPESAVFSEPIHRSHIESKLDVEDPIRWFAFDNWAGYRCENTGQSVHGPAPPLAELIVRARDQLTPSLQGIYDLEVELKNIIVRVDEPAGSACPLAIRFRDPLHRTEIEALLSPLSDLSWWENRDPHYPQEGGYASQSTGQAIAGPLPI